MAILSINNITKFYGAQRVLNNVSFQVERGDKVALVGSNGAGKSTLLRIIAGHETPDGGSVSFPSGLRTIYMAQDATIEGSLTLLQAMQDATLPLRQLQEEIAHMEERLGDSSAPDWEAHMEHYSELVERFEHADGYRLDQRIDEVLHRLEFRPHQYEQPVARLSGGQRTRAALAAALLSDPDLLMLDEPTNHLDIEAIEWLEDFLKNWQGTLLVIAHDRYFLDRVTKQTLDLSFGEVETYDVPYTRFLDQKAERLERRMIEFKAQQEFIARTEEFIRRYKAGVRAREAKGREKRLNRYKEQVAVPKIQQKQSLKLKANDQPRGSDTMLTLTKLAVGYTDAEKAEPHILARADKIEVRQGERIGLVGPNGSGKTTMLRTLLGEIPPLQGKFRFGLNAVVSYYAQSHDTLDRSGTVMDALMRVNNLLDIGQARNLLARFMFYGDDVYKPVSALSGGERSRLALAVLLQNPSNLLIMDEPTNHLDIQARESLEEMLREFGGSLIFVSHDRFFIDALAEKLWVIADGNVQIFQGTYSEYVKAKTGRKA